MIEKSEYYKNISETIAKLSEIGTDTQTLQNIAQEFGITLKFSQPKQTEQFAEMFAEETDLIEIIAQNLTNKIMDNIEKSTIAFKEAVEEFLAENKGKLTVSNYNELNKMINDKFKEITYTKAVDAALIDAVRTTGLLIDTDSSVIKFAKNYTYDNIKKLTENQKSRLKHIIVEELSTTEDTGISTRIMETLNTTRYEAERIARTELSRAVEYSRKDYYEKYAQKHNVKVIAKWNTRKDSKVCPACRELEGKEWDINKIPQIPPLHPNCRCYLTYRIVDVEK
jgi:SPP1 gp7 family putative phage head morphogenesis protein